MATKYYICKFFNNSEKLYRVTEDTGLVHYWYLPTGEWDKSFSFYSADDITHDKRWTAISEEEAKLWIFENEN